MGETRIHIPHELFAPAESSYFSGVFDLPVLTAGPDVYTIAEPLSWNATISNTGDGLLVAGTVEGTVETQCARCLEAFSCSLFGEIEGYFVLADGDVAPEGMDEDEFELLPTDNVIDMEPLIRAALLLELPFIPLCGEDCKGICPDCGCNLNEESCGCAQERAAEEGVQKNPFSVLEELQIKEDS